MSLRSKIKELERKTREQSLLIEMTDVLFRGSDLETAIKSTLGLAMKITKSEAGCLLVINTLNELEVFEVSGNMPICLINSFSGLSQKFFPQAADELRQFNKQDCYFNFFSRLDPALKSLIIIPLAIGGKIIGYSIIMHRHDNDPGHSTFFSYEDMRNLRIFAHQVSMLLENTRLKIEHGKKEVYLKTIASLISAIDAKDMYTQNHSSRVAKITVKFAKAIGLSEEKINRMRYGALLHDIGKIGVKDLILNKPGKLDQKEFDKIREHPLLGEKILSPMEPEPEVLNIIKYHHERYDGTGYPSGLEGEAIPFEARVVSIVDAWDAMTSNRSYRDKLSFSNVIEELNKGAGTQFDPILAIEFIKLVQKSKESVIF